MEETKRVEIDDPPRPEITSASLMISRERVMMQPGSPNVMMPALKIPECNPTTGSIGGKALIIEAPSVQVLSSSSEGEDYDFGHEPAPSDASKFFYMTEEEMQVAAPETELPSRETVTTEVSFLFHLCFSCDVILTPAWMILCKVYRY